MKQVTAIALVIIVLSSLFTIEAFGKKNLRVGNGPVPNFCRSGCAYISGYCVRDRFRYNRTVVRKARSGDVAFLRRYNILCWEWKMVYMRLQILYKSNNNFWFSSNKYKLYNVANAPMHHFIIKHYKNECTLKWMYPIANNNYCISDIPSCYML